MCLFSRRLDALRLLVPHAERANTASFLDEAISYIKGLQKRIAELEGRSSVPAPDVPAAPANGAGM